MNLKNSTISLSLLITFGCIISMILFVPVILLGQEIEAKQLYKEAARKFNAGKYQLAESLASESIKLNPTKDTYYLLAKIKEIQGDSCEYCMNLKESFSWMEEDRYQEYQHHCLTIDAFTYNECRIDRPFTFPDPFSRTL
ncbi:MAG: hypothetical protein D4R67_07030 [Bacteroidetes bacterium]|nr:MAG: hypothetical protein D4R67_07030 [Bacteroidota bacterium]